MKKLFLLPVLYLALSGLQCTALKKMGLVPSELEMAMGLKEALSQGLFKGFAAFADTTGNPRCGLPSLAKPEKLNERCGISDLIKPSIR